MLHVGTAVIFQFVCWLYVVNMSNRLPNSSTKNPFVKKRSIGVIDKYKKNYSRKLRRQRSKFRYLQRLRCSRFERITQEMSDLISFVNVTDHREMKGEKDGFEQFLDNWSLQQELVHWKSRAISLEYENRMLHEHIKNVYRNLVSIRVREDPNARRQPMEPQESPMALATEEEPPTEPRDVDRHQMRELYGSMASKINAMEIAMQIGYNLEIEKYDPPYWPCVPLKL